MASNLVAPSSSAGRIATYPPHPPKEEPCDLEGFFEKRLKGLEPSPFCRQGPSAESAIAFVARWRTPHERFGDGDNAGGPTGSRRSRTSDSSRSDRDYSGHPSDANRHACRSTHKTPHGAAYIYA